MAVRSLCPFCGGEMEIYEEADLGLLEDWPEDAILQSAVCVDCEYEEPILS